MKTQTDNIKGRKGEQGNVLFLILIAVALFAALSYAVTQSTRSGSGDASSEKSLVSSAALTQYPASIKTAITRMIISNGVDPNLMVFTKPADFDDLTDTASTPETYKTNAVFYPTGGGATYTDAPKDVSTLTTAAPWVFNGNNEVFNIGTTSASAAATQPTADIMAILPDVTKALCDKIHDQLGIAKVYDTWALNLTNMDTTTPLILSTAGVVIGSDALPTLKGQPQGCVLLSANRYAYYHVLVER